MVKVYAVQVRLTRAQHERIKENARLRGFSTVSDYVRFVALDHQQWLETKLLDLHRHFLGSPAKGEHGVPPRSPTP